MNNLTSYIFDNICKIGIPVNSLEKYIEKLNSIKYSYIIYDYNKEKNELIEKYTKIGKQNKKQQKNWQKSENF